jgi:hypothetical protein
MSPVYTSLAAFRRSYAAFRRSYAAGTPRLGTARARRGRELRFLMDGEGSEAMSVRLGEPFARFRSSKPQERYAELAALAATKMKTTRPGSRMSIRCISSPARGQSQS